MGGLPADDERALVFVDFFPPIVDDPDDFGRSRRRMR
jgi:hypothetical protein